MAQQTVNNGDSGLSARTKINANDAELYILAADAQATADAAQTDANTALTGKADLVGGLVPASQLPSYVDDVLEYANLAAFPVTGSSGTIYLAIDTNITYRWSGSIYVSLASGLALGETSSTAYRGDRGKTAYDHSQLITGNPHNVTKSDIGLSNVNNIAVTGSNTGDQDLSTLLVKASNLSDLTNFGTARTNLGLGTLATQSGTFSGTHSGTSSGTNTGDQPVVGVQDLFIPAAAMWPRVTNGCSPLAQTEMTTSLFNIKSLDFNQTTQQYAQFQIVLPRKYNNSTITFRAYWTAASGSGTVTWELSGGAYSDDDALTVALGTAQASTDTLITANDLHISPESSAITIAGTPADADFLALQISRNITDTLSADAKLLGISVRITTDSGVDQ